ncbi:MAG: hypothetical protein CVT48_00330 [Thermoplasmata archaeon HGW-Thermoplasmata-1]|nr:MAG: hypothetical protein CVT48_00330 [Thermoplasmata archaeon HGW-Thermoplasmata-1]
MYIEEGAIIALIGMGVVFLFLSILALLISLLGRGGAFFDRLKKKKGAEKNLLLPGPSGIVMAEEEAIRDAMSKFLLERYGRKVEFEIKEIKKGE